MFKVFSIAMYNFLTAYNAKFVQLHFSLEINYNMIWYISSLIMSSEVTVIQLKYQAIS